VEKGKRGAVAASAIGGAAVIAAIVLFASGAMGGILTPGSNGNNMTTVASPPDGAPKMVLVVLKGDEDSSRPVAQYDSNNTQPIQLANNAHVRFDSPEYRTAESMRVIARDLDDGSIQLLRKSYDVNNEFFINLSEGRYDLEVQASWFEKGSFVYKFDITVT